MEAMMTPTEIKFRDKLMDEHKYRSDYTDEERVFWLQWYNVAMLVKSPNPAEAKRAGDKQAEMLTKRGVTCRDMPRDFVEDDDNPVVNRYVKEQQRLRNQAAYRKSKASYGDRDKQIREVAKVLRHSYNWPMEYLAAALRPLLKAWQVKDLCRELHKQLRKHPKP
jgi:hypothetical protein